MNAVVWKYDVMLDDIVELQMPHGAQLLHAAEQHGQLRLWARVDPEQRLVTRKIRVAGTGHPGAHGEHFATAFVRSGMLVWHLFDLGEVKAAD